MLKVEVIYIAENQQLFHRHLNLKDGATVAEALSVSALHDHYPETSDFSLGIFSKPVTAETLLKNGDRIEVYRPLTRDPKQKRRERAKKS